MIIDYCIKDLQETKEFLDTIPPSIYNRKIAFLFKASIGQHVRHILEFYGCLLNGQSQELINYDSRVRSIALESDTTTASDHVVSLQDFLKEEFNDHPVNLISNFSPNEDALESIKTTMLRELAYCFEHSIHHKALIKVGLLSIEQSHLIDSNFGVAPSTIRNQKISLTTLSNS